MRKIDEIAKKEGISVEHVFYRIVNETLEDPWTEISDVNDLFELSCDLLDLDPEDEYWQNIYRDYIQDID